MTEEEYLAFDRVAPYKHEFINGEVIAMAGASPRHNEICFNIQGLLRSELRNKPCRGYASDMRVHSSGSYVYPDVTVVCGKPEIRENDILENPTAIFEILSPSTEKKDRGRKFLSYQSLSSLKEYILVAQTEMRIEHYVKTDEGPWLLQKVLGPGETLGLLSCGAELLMDEVYAKVFSDE